MVKRPQAGQNLQPASPFHSWVPDQKEYVSHDSGREVIVPDVGTEVAKVSPRGQIPEGHWLRELGCHHKSQLPGIKTAAPKFRCPLLSPTWPSACSLASEAPATTCTTGLQFSIPVGPSRVGLRSSFPLPPGPFYSALKAHPPPTGVTAQLPQ